MTDGINANGTALTEIVRRQSGYQADSVRQVQARAAAVEQRESPEERESLRRLNRILSLDQPLNDEVPRGYYLNIEV